MKVAYIHTEEVHNMVAPREVVPIIMDIVNPKSVLDVGCGTGTWLKAFEELGTSDYVGVDGDFLNRSQLNIPIEKFIAKDLRTPWLLNRKFDLVLSLEVAEHLPKESADQFVETLVNHTNSAIIFSAAVPGQGGQNHLNEQWPEYWQKKFEPFGFYFHDVIRPKIWINERVDYWYRQNIFLVKKEKPTLNPFPSCSIIHPQFHEIKIQNEKEYYQSLVEGQQGMRISLTIFLNAIKFKFKNLFD